MFGGTFDPIHNAHLQVALEVFEGLSLGQLRFVPNARPPHRDTPGASSDERLRLLQIAIADQPGFAVDDRELRRDGPSYMIDTLSSLRAEHRDTPLCLIVGQDAFLGLPEWHRWQQLCDFAHLLVLSRPGYRIDGDPELTALSAARRTTDPLQLHQRDAGCILFYPVTPLTLSATRVRALLAAGRSPRYLLPADVLDEIHRQRLYQGSAADVGNG